MDLRHIILKGVSDGHGYTGTGRGNFDSFHRTTSQRKEHGERLKLQLEDILPNIQNDDDGNIDESGVYLEIISEPGFELKSESIDVMGCRLCNIRDLADKTQRATVFIDDAKRHRFVRKLEKYHAQDGGQTSNTLFDNISIIRLASLKQFWTSTLSSYPDNNESIWWEVWLARQSTERIEADEFLYYCQSQGLQISTARSDFPLNTLYAVKATESELSESILLISCLSELRRITDTARFLLQQSQYEQVQWMDNLRARTNFSYQANVSILILDYGVNYNHPLLFDGIKEENCFAWKSDWSVYDTRNIHGTMQAGLAFFGDIATAMLSDEPINISYDIESCRILAPEGDTDKELYGSLTYYAVNSAEDNLGSVNRVVSMAITADHDNITGQPTSWSSEVDQLAFNGNHQRLFLVSAGNIRGSDVHTDYKRNVNQHGIEDPGQSWNSLTVGACTHKVDVTEHYYKDWKELAAAGDISPTSRTSNNWEWRKEAPIKPDVVEEGGNLLLPPDGGPPTNADCVSLITTADISRGHVFTDHGQTSAANALVSRIAANIWDSYPDLWAETVRALVVHSASWTPTMLSYWEVAIGQGASPRDAKELMLRMFGHGIPSMQKAMASAQNYLTMIVEGEIKPYKYADGSVKFDEMQLIELPWPRNELLKLGNSQCRLRVTLSYFIEPNPSRRGFSHRFRYQPFGLRFKMQNPNEDAETFLLRINRSLREEGEDFEGEADNSGWLLGDHLRTRGSLHQDTWEGSASDLTLRNHLGIIPVAGWWKQTKSKLYEDRSEASVPYSLLLSLEVDSEFDIYTEVAQQVGIEPTIGIEVPAN